MTGRVKVIKRRTVSTGQLRRRPEGAARAENPEPPLRPEVEQRMASEPIPAAPASIHLPPAPEESSSATVEVVSSSPETTELRVCCACGCETVIALNHPAEGGAA